jgi:hypothetical protein
MAIDWTAYDGFDWEGASQAPLDERGRATLTEFVADLLGLTADLRQGAWGVASPPGRFAAAVVRVVPGVPHRFADRSSALGVKVLKTTRDAQNQARQLVPFHRDLLARLPGIPHSHVQKSFTAGLRRDAQGAERAYIVQEWVEGDTLDDLVRRHWPPSPPTAEVVRSILEQLLGAIIIPLWALGTVWWDIRDANYCYSSASRRLTLIDVDSLAAYTDEILLTPGVWERRNKGQRTALARLRQMGIRLVKVQGTGVRKVEGRFRALWEAELEPALLRLGHEPGAGERAQEALGRFLDGLADPPGSASRRYTV